jgi:iron(III) transport system permease protein
MAQGVPRFHGIKSVARLRPVIAGIWLVIVIFPGAILVRELLRYPEAWSVWGEADRILPLLRNTLLLALGTVAVTTPLGTVLGFLLYRSDLPGRVFLRRLVVLAMFVPLPLLATAWQAALTNIGFGPVLPTSSIDVTTWSPWNRGLTATILIHAAAGLPWIIWLAGQGFCGVPRGLEEDALVNGGVWAAFRHVTLPRALPAIGAAALWVALQAATEISVTDLTQVRTFAEEVYTQFSRPDPVPAGDADLGMARALAVAVPPALLTALLITTLAMASAGRMPAIGATGTDRPLLKLRTWRWPVLFAPALAVALLVGVPVVSLVLKAGAMPPANAWSAEVAAQQMARAWHAQSERIVMSLLGAAGTAVGVAALAWLTCWFVRGRHIGPGALFFGLVLVWCLPGPVVGMGLKETINVLLDVEDALSGERSRLLRGLLYTGPSAAPVMWAAALRFLPAAVALLWPAVRRVPRDVYETALADGASAVQQLRHVVFPPTASSLARAALGVTALALGELSAGKLVQTPGGQTFASEIFNQMHFGLNNHLAAMCLLLLALIALLGIVAEAARALTVRRIRSGANLPPRR